MPNQGFFGIGIASPASDLLPRFTRQGAVTAKAAPRTERDGLCHDGLELLADCASLAPRGLAAVGALAAMRVGASGVAFSGREFISFSKIKWTNC